VTVPRATRCNRRVAPGRWSPAAPSGRGHSDPAAGVWARRSPSRARTCAHRRARRPRSARARPLRHRRPPPASAAPLELRRPRHRRRWAPVVLHSPPSPPPRIVSLHPAALRRDEHWGLGGHPRSGEYIPGGRRPEPACPCQCKRGSRCRRSSGHDACWDTCLVAC